MIRKIILSLFVVLLVSSTANAEVFKAKILTQLDTKNPPKTISLKAVSQMNISNYVIEKDYILNGEVIDVIQPQAFGKNATFSLKLTSYQDLSGNIHEINDYVIKYRQKLKPNWERQSFSFMGSTDGGRTETGFEISPYDFKLMKESKNVGDFLWKDMTKDAFWQPGWDLKYKPNEVIYFNY